MASNNNYELVATQYCERYGIVQYKVQGYKLIYNVSYPAYLSNPRYTVQHTIDLRDMSHSSKQLQRFDSKGLENRG
jgi:hypothetical protein